MLKVGAEFPYGILTGTKYSEQANASVLCREMALPIWPCFPLSFPGVKQGALRKKQSWKEKAVARRARALQVILQVWGGGGGLGCCHPVVTDTVEVESDHF